MPDPLLVELMVTKVQDSGSIQHYYFLGSLCILSDAILWRRQGPLQVYKKRKTSPVCSCQWQPRMCGLRFHLQILPNSQDGFDL